ncbi:MAG TPA: hypothetical protein VIU86_16050, partial [Gaiellaceae bacterium]
EACDGEERTERLAGDLDDVDGAEAVVAGPTGGTTVAEVDSGADPEPKAADDVVAGDPLGRPAQQLKRRRASTAKVGFHPSCELQIAGFALAEDGDRAGGTRTSLDASGGTGEELELGPQVGQPADRYEPSACVLDKGPRQRRPRPAPPVADEQQA